MTKRSFGIVLNAVAVASLCLPALVLASGPSLPPGPAPCVSTPNSTHRCPPPKKSPITTTGAHYGR